MDIYAATITDESMMYDEDNKMYYGTILATDHGFGVNAFVVRAVHRDSQLALENILCSYKVLSNGDVRIYVDEPISLRVTIGRGVPVSRSTLLEEGDNYADA
jgi:hypothetical protein|nr:MAG TPA: hypothetical protein [Bacteriophage sp.]